MDAPFTLTQSERRSPVMQRLAAHWRDELAKLRVANDGMHPESVTNFNRGRIARLKDDLKLVEDAPPPPQYEDGTL